MTGSGGDDRGDDEDEPEKTLSSSILQTMTGYRIHETRYIAFFEDGTQTRGETDEEGYTERFLYLANMKLK